MSFCWTVNRICVIVECFLGLLQYLIAVMRVFPKAIVHSTEPRIDALHFLASRRSLVVRTIAFRKTVCIYYVYKNRPFVDIAIAQIAIKQIIEYICRKCGTQSLRTNPHPAWSLERFLFSNLKSQSTSKRFFSHIY